MVLTFYLITPRQGIGESLVEEDSLMMRSEDLMK